MSSPRRPELSEEEYLDIEATLTSNARGRAFLEMRDERARVVALSDMRQIADSISAIKKDLTAGTAQGATPDSALREELRAMSAYIHQTRSEIAALRPADAGSNRIMAATGELESIVLETERATSDILSGVERIQALALKLPKDGDMGKIAAALQKEVTEMLTACSFQDITGQRTTKVVSTLHYIEQRVNSMVGIWGAQDGGGVPAPDIKAAEPDDAPMHAHAPEPRPSQADIDAIFAGAGKAGARAGDRGAGPAAKSPSASQSQIDALFSNQ
jgi:chemotaxis regulatin CheY-phosphate phosphatase CheZ